MAPRTPAERIAEHTGPRVVGGVPATTHLRLRDDLRVVERTEGGRSMVIVCRPGGKAYRFRPAALRALQSLDGRTSFEELACRLAAPTGRRRLIEFLETARRAGLLSGEADDVPGPRPFKNPLFYRLPLVDANKPLAVLRPAIEPLFSLPAVFLFGLSLLASVGLIWAARDRCAASFAHFRHAESWLIAYGLMLLVSVVHELGHAIACLRYGGRVHSIGLLFNMLQPGLYTDVNDAWLLPKRRQRIVVSLAGVYMHMMLFPPAVLLWFLTPPGSLASQLGFLLGVVLVQSAAINMLPVLRLDGYFVLSDLLGIPNLRSVSMAYCLSLLPRFGWRWSRPGSASRRRRLVLFSYGLLSLFSVVLALVWILTRAHDWLVRLAPEHGAALGATLTLLVLIMVVHSLCLRLAELPRAVPGLGTLPRGVHGESGEEAFL
jgi:hypothetical protein